MCACQPSCAAGQLMERRERGQEGSAVARCGAGLLLLGNEEWKARRGKVTGGRVTLPEVRDKEEERKVRRRLYTALSSVFR